MLIQVVFSDNHFGYFENYELDRLLELHQVARFRRSTGWVVIGVDPVRSEFNELSHYSGPERRRVLRVDTDDGTADYQFVR
jgi:hypothetical protein